MKGSNSNSNITAKDLKQKDVAKADYILLIQEELRILVDESQKKKWSNWLLNAISPIFMAIIPILTCLCDKEVTKAVLIVIFAMLAIIGYLLPLILKIPTNKINIAQHASDIADLIVMTRKERANAILEKSKHENAHLNSN